MASKNYSYSYYNSLINDIIFMNIKDKMRDGIVKDNDIRNF